MRLYANRPVPARGLVALAVAALALAGCGTGSAAAPILSAAVPIGSAAAQSGSAPTASPSLQGNPATPPAVPGAGAMSPVPTGAVPGNSSPVPSAVPSAGVPSAPAAPPASKAQQEIDRLTRVLTADPTDGTAYRDLGIALLQRVRETADPSLYVRADEAFRRARALTPDDPLIDVGVGTLQLARHQFADALTSADRVLKRVPVFPSAQAVKVDALVELGRYDQAVAAAQALVNVRPDLASFSRVSYLRELHGDLPGALQAMEQAQTAGADAPENVAYISVLRGNLLAYLGRRQEAAAAYGLALDRMPDYAPAVAAQGRLALAAGDLPTAIERFSHAAEIVPLPEYVIALGEANEVAGNAAAAHRAYDLARAETQLFQANGVVVDLELALFEADHGDPARALTLARQAYAERRTVRTADALAWAMFRNHDLAEARTHSAEALRLGAQDPLLLYHAGAIAAAAGDRATARRDLARALQLDPGFSATGAAAARALLVTLR